MITGQIKNHIDQIWDTFWTGGITNSITILEQMTYLFFMKMLDDQQLQQEQVSQALGIEMAHYAKELMNPVPLAEIQEHDNDLAFNTYKETVREVVEYETPEVIMELKNADDHLLIRSCVFHYEFEFIHPFIDGNGRMGRLWQSLILTQLHPLFAHLPVENMVFSNQQAYYDAIAASTAAGESTPFIEFMFGEILATLEKHKGEERADFDEKASPLEREFGIIFGEEFGIKFGIKFGDNDKKLLLLMNSNPTFSSQMISDRLEITKRAVEKIIKRLREANIIERVGSNKSGYWKVNRRMDYWFN